MEKKIKRIFFIAVIALAIFFLLEHVLLVSAVKAALRYVVALDTQMNRVAFNPLTGCITVKGFKIFNPPGFKERILARIPLIRMDLKAKTLFENGVFFDEIMVRIKEINIVRNKENEVNVTKMKAFAPKDKREGKTPFLADRYIVEIEKVSYADHTQEGKAAPEEITLDIQEQYKNVRNPENIVNAVGFKLYLNDKLRNIGINVQKIQKELARLAEENKKLKEEFVKIVQTKTEEAKEKIKDTVEAIKNSLESDNANTNITIKSRKEDADKR